MLAATSTPDRSGYVGSTGLCRAWYAGMFAPGADRDGLYRRRVAESAFTVTFGGPVRTGGRIPVRDLSPALLALGELFADASVLVDPDREPATLSIDTIDAGSASIRLVLELAEQTTRLTDLLTTEASTTLRVLQEVVIGPSGILQLTRQTAGQDIVDRTAAEDGTVRVTLSDGAIVDAREEAVNLYLDRSGRRNAGAVVRPLRRPGVETLELVSTTTAPTLITALDADAFLPPPPAELPAEESEVEMLVDVAAPAFPVNNKWRLSNGMAGSFWATIGDGAFLNRVNAGEPFRKGDSLRCRFKVTRTHTPLGLQLEHHVIEVLQHVARGEQLRLDTAA